ncbi:MAG: hypothetical protein ACM3P1_08470 [Candidatus Saccharibacteria bacterium]
MEDNLTQYEEQTDTMDNDLKIYSKRAIIGFTLFFSTIFGAVLLMQNLKDIGKKKEANLLLLLSILYTVITIVIVNIPERPNTFLTYLCNFVGAMILTEFVYKKYFPEEAFEKKEIWKPLIISLLITIPFVLAMISTL